ncbi:MAG: hypothetical protein ACR2M9_01890, partial [Cyanophyceae cyanobacterium]
MNDDKRDIVTRLRGLAHEGGFVAKLKLLEAADEIERLRELLKDLYDRGGISNELWHRIKSE